MDLTKNQEANLIEARKAFIKAKNKLDAANQEFKLRLDKLKECSQGVGSPEQVLATTDGLLAQCYLRRVDEFDQMEG